MLGLCWTKHSVDVVRKHIDKEEINGMTKNSKHSRNWVKEVRRQLEISQEELAHELGVSFTTVTR